MDIDTRKGPTNFGWAILGYIAAIAFGIFALSMLFHGVAFGQDNPDIVVAIPPTEVVLNWGDFLAILLANLADPSSVAWTAFGLALTWLVTRLPGPLQFAFKLFQVEQLLRNAISASVNSTKGAVEGKTLGIDVGSQVLAKALQYAIDNGQKSLIDWMGGETGIQDKLIARIPLSETVSGAELVKKADAAPKSLTDD